MARVSHATPCHLLFVAPQLDNTQVWDDELGYLLGPSLFAYEQERVDGASFGSGDFQDAVQGAVPDRYNIAVSNRFRSWPSHLTAS